MSETAAGLESFDNPTKFEPFKGKGRSFLKEGLWVFITVGNQDYYVKVTEEHYRNLCKGLPFEAHHPMAVQIGNAPMFMPQMVGTYNAWNITAVAVHALVHPDLAKHLDDVLSKGLSVIAEATLGEVAGEAAKAARPKLALLN